MAHSIFSPQSWGKKVTEILSRSSSGGLDTPEVKKASVPVPALRSIKHALQREK